MTSELIEKIKNASREVTIVGSSPLFSDQETWSKLVNEVFPALATSEAKVTVIAESDNQLFQLSLTTDASFTPGGARISFTDLRMQQDMLRREVKKVSQQKSNWTHLTSSIFLNYSAIKIDEEIFVSPVANPFLGLSRHKKIDRTDVWYGEVVEYITNLLDSKRNRLFLSSPEDELLELFDKDQIPRGIFPRACFYGTDHFQYVVWAFIFDRSGRLLIHQRSITAKDNQGMWDKSVGGHVDFAQERSSHYAAVRELVEELFTDESDNADDMGFLRPSVDRPYFMGDWRPGSLGVDYLKHVSLIESEHKVGKEPWFYYKIQDSIERDTPRILEDGTERRLRVIADVFVFLTDTKFSQAVADKKIQNSNYRLCLPGELKHWLDTGQGLDQEFIGTPDLNFVMNGKLRDSLEEFSQIVKFAPIRR